MPTSPKHSVLIIGVGNEHRGDDAAGLVAARLLSGRSLPLRVVEEFGEATALIDLWRSSAGQNVYLIDAMVSGQPPGYLQRFDARCEALPAALGGGSSHMFSVAQAVELARTLDNLPRKLIIYGIEAKSFDFGAGLSPEVELGARIAVESILAECFRP